MKKEIENVNEETISNKKEEEKKDVEEAEQKQDSNHQ